MEFLPAWMFLALTILLMAGFPVTFTKVNLTGKAYAIHDTEFVKKLLVEFEEKCKMSTGAQKLTPEIKRDLRRIVSPV